MWVRFPPSPPSAGETKKPAGKQVFLYFRGIIAQPNKPIPTNKERNELIVRLKNEGLTLKEISEHPEIIRLSNNKILTLSRVAQIYRKTKGGDKDGN